MHRHPSLIPLSHDHHHGLALCLRIRKGLENDQIDELVNCVCQYRTDELERHFEQEERFIFPLIPDTDERVLRAMIEHRQLRSYVQCLETSQDRETQRNTLIDFATHLHDHIRFEERELFPFIEQNADLTSIR